jgi:hypothetical protein
VSPRLAFRKATDLLPVTGPVSSHEKGDHDRSPFFIPEMLFLLIVPAIGARLETHMAAFNCHREKYSITAELLFDSVRLGGD